MLQNQQPQHKQQQQQQHSNKSERDATTEVKLVYFHFVEKIDFQ